MPSHAQSRTCTALARMGRLNSVVHVFSEGLVGLALTIHLALGGMLFARGCRFWPAKDVLALFFITLKPRFE